MNAQEKSAREIEAFLAGEATLLDAIYRKLPHLEPDADLDKAVLDMARRADIAPHSTAIHRRLRKTDSPWLFALSSAAALALVVTLAWRAGTSTWNRPGHSALPASVSSSQITSLDDTPLSQPPGELDKKNLPSEQSKLDESLKDGMSMDKQVSPKLAPAASTTEIERSRRSDSSLREKEKTTAQKPPLASEPMSPPPPPAPLQREVRSHDDLSPTNEPQPFVKLGESMASLDRADEVKPVVSATPNAPSSLGGTEKQNQAKKLEKTEGSIQAEALERSNADQRGSFKSAPGQTPATSTDSAPLTSTLREEEDDITTNRGIVGDASEVMKPHEWIMRIRKLIQEGNTKEAHTNLEKFRRKYPNYPLPANLQELAP